MNFTLPYVDSLLTNDHLHISKEFLYIFRLTLYIFYDYKQRELFNNYRKVSSFYNLFQEQILNDKAQLPIYKYKDEILETVQSNQVVVISGDTGCGKSTQVCSIDCLLCIDSPIFV